MKEITRLMDLYYTFHTNNLKITDCSRISVYGVKCLTCDGDKRLCLNA